MIETTPSKFQHFLVQRTLQRVAALALVRSVAALPHPVALIRLPIAATRQTGPVSGLRVAVIHDGSRYFGVREDQ